MGRNQLLSKKIAIISLLISLLFVYFLFNPEPPPTQKPKPTQPTTHTSSHNTGTMANCRDAINIAAVLAESDHKVESIDHSHGRYVNIYYKMGGYLMLVCDGTTVHKEIEYSKVELTEEDIEFRKQFDEEFQEYMQNIYDEEQKQYEDSGTRFRDRPR